MEARQGLEATSLLLHFCDTKQGSNRAKMASMWKGKLVPRLNIYDDEMTNGLCDHPFMELNNTLIYYQENVDDDTQQRCL